MYDDAGTRVDARRQIDELPGVGPHLAAHMQMRQTLLEGELGPCVQHYRHVQAVEGDACVVHVLRIEQVAVAGGSQLEIPGPVQEPGPRQVGRDAERFRFVAQRVEQGGVRRHRRILSELQGIA